MNDFNEFFKVRAWRKKARNKQKKREGFDVKPDPVILKFLKLYENALIL